MPFNPEKITPETPKKASEAKDDLEKKFHKKSLKERFVSEVATREAFIRGSEKKRGEVFRFERGQILKAYKILRAQIEEARQKGESTIEKKNLLKQIRERAKFLEKNLDELNRQYYEGVKTVEIDTKYGKFTIPIAELDLNKDVEPEKDTRTPYFLIGGIAQKYAFQTVVLSLALALDGHKVFIYTYPEQSMVQRPDNFREMLKNQGDLKIHAELAKQTIKKWGLKDVNIVGYSMGGAIALELAVGPDLKELKDLIIIEPLGIEEKGLPRLAKEFALEQGLLKTLPYSEARIKTFKQGRKENTGNFGFLLEDAKILSKKYFWPERLKEIKPTGRYQVWVGTESPIVDDKIAENIFLETEVLRKSENPDTMPLEFYKVEGGDHGWPFMNATGFSRILEEERPKQQTTTVKLSELENSAIVRILKDIE